MDLRDQKFGIEIELTGITRYQTAKLLAKHFGTVCQSYQGRHEDYNVWDGKGRKWGVKYDGSIIAKTSDGNPASDLYKVELVSPICDYGDIPVIQTLARKLSKAGAFASEKETCGIHVHINASPHDARTLRNITNIMYSKEDMIYRALQVDVSREQRYCKKVEESFINELNQKKPRTLDQVSDIWYGGKRTRFSSGHSTRYHCLNLHSVFEKGTIEFRLFNSTLQPERIKAYIQFSLAVSAQALNQKNAGRIKTVSSNEKYTFRTWLLRLGMIGEEFKDARNVLLENLEGSIAWKDPEQAIRQRERIRAQREKDRVTETEQMEIEENGMNLMM